MKALETLVFIGALLMPQLAFSQSAPSLSEMTEMPAHRAFVSQSAEATLAPFTTDGCSGGMSDIWAATAAQFPQWAENQGTAPPWEACCVAHDHHYHNGGGKTEAEQSYDARLSADEALRVCVLDQGARDQTALALAYGFSTQTIDFLYKAIAQGMYLAVRLGGAPCSGLPWRWGYGFPDCTNFAPS